MTESADGQYQLEGVCPECDGEANVYVSKTDGDEGHIYCREGDCGWIYCNVTGISRFVDTETD